MKRITWLLAAVAACGSAPEEVAPGVTLIDSARIGDVERYTFDVEGASYTVERADVDDGLWISVLADGAPSLGALVGADVQFVDLATTWALGEVVHCDDDCGAGPVERALVSLAASDLLPAPARTEPEQSYRARYYTICSEACPWYDEECLYWCGVAFCHDGDYPHDCF